MTKKFVISNYLLEFYQEEGDAKWRFRIIGEPTLTQQLLESVKTKRVTERGIKYAVPAIEQRIKEIISKKFNPQKQVSMNPIIELNEKCQKKYGMSIETELVSKTGADHSPSIKVKVTMPTGDYAYGTASNQKEARKEAAKKLLDLYF